MEIKSISPTIRKTFRVVRSSGAEEDVTLEFGPLAVSDVTDHVSPGNAAAVTRGEIVQAMVIRDIVGWDLTTDGKPIPCDAVNKGRILPTLLRLRVKEFPSDDPYGSLGWRVCLLAQDDSNFLGESRPTSPIGGSTGTPCSPSQSTSTR